MKELRSALNSILCLLKHEVDLDLWMVTRVVDDDWIMLATTENTYDVEPDDIISWSTSVCNRMVSASGPNIVTSVEQVDEYANAPITKDLKFKSYIGYPLNDENGEVMGTLCAIDSREQDPELETKNQLFQDFVTVVETLMQQDIELQRLNTLVKEYKALDTSEEELGLPNQAAFTEIATLQKGLMRSSGSPLAIIYVKINKFPQNDFAEDDSLESLKSVRDILTPYIREQDVLCKLKGNDFGMLLMNVNNKQLTSTVINLLRDLHDASLKVDVGAHVCRQNENINEAIQNAKSRTFA